MLISKFPRNHLSCGPDDAGGGGKRHLIPRDHIQSFWQTTTARMISPLVADLKPGVFNAPLRGCGALTSATSGEAGIHVVDAQ
jgi:hypothetical protein